MNYDNVYSVYFERRSGLGLARLAIVSVQKISPSFTHCMMHKVWCLRMVVIAALHLVVFETIFL